MGSASSGSLALGMNLSVICREMAPFTSRQAIAQANSDLPPMLATHFVAKGVLDLCDYAERCPRRLDRALGDLERSTALVLSGGYDPVTPPAWSALAASTLSHAIFLELADQSHGAFEGACGRNAVDHFVADPSAAPDVSCADALPPIALLAPAATKAAALVRSWEAHERLPDAVVASILRGMRQSRTRLSTTAAVLAGADHDSIRFRADPTLSYGEAVGIPHFRVAFGRHASPVPLRRSTCAACPVRLSGRMAAPMIDLAQRIFGLSVG